MEGPHPVFGKKAHAVQHAAIGQHSVEPGVAPGIHDPLGSGDTGLAYPGGYTRSGRGSYPQPTMSWVHLLRTTISAGKGR